jgi:hypothetical protein
MKKYILKFLILVLPLHLFAQFSQTPPPYRVFIELKAGLHMEFNKLTDPGNQLITRAPIEPTTGINAGVYLNDGRSVIGLDYDILTIGNSLPFRTVPSSYGSGRRFQRLTLNFQYHVPIIHNKERPLLSLVGKVGPSINFNGGPKGSTGTVEIYFLDSNNIASAFNVTQRKVNRAYFAGITLGGGLVYTPNSRLRFTYSIYPSVNLTSNDVMIQDVQYRYFNELTVRNARVLNTGSTITQSISMGYSFGNTKYRKEELQKSRMKYSDEDWEKRKRWSLVFITGGCYPTINKHDPAGYMAATREYKSRLGAQVFYRIKPKWILGTGIETVPFQLNTGMGSDFRHRGGTNVRSSQQIPLMAEYIFLQTKGKIKLEWMARAGFAIGIQRKVVSDPNTDYDYTFVDSPDYYAEFETKDRPSTSFLGGLVGTRLNIYLSSKLFLSGYLQQQWALSNNEFHRSRNSYQVGSPQAPVHESELTTKGTMFLPGFGIGFQL